MCWRERIKSLSNELLLPNLKKIMKKKITVLTLCAVLFALPHFSAQAQQAGKIFRIGLLDPSDASSSAVRLRAFWQELRKLGWVEEKNITVEYRFAEEKIRPSI